MKNLSKIATLCLLTLPALVFAGDYTPLVNLPGVDPNGDFGSYINALYTIAISVAAILAVLKIVIAGVRYMLTDVVSNKQTAKSDIQGAVLGLIIVLGAVIILETVNTNLTNLNLLVIDTENNTLTAEAKPSNGLTQSGDLDVTSCTGVVRTNGTTTSCSEPAGACGGINSFADSNGQCQTCPDGTGYVKANGVDTCPPHSCPAGSNFAGYEAEGDLLVANCQEDCDAGSTDGICDTYDSSTSIGDNETNALNNDVSSQSGDIEGASYSLAEAASNHAFSIGDSGGSDSENNLENHRQTVGFCEWSGGGYSQTINTKKCLSGQAEIYIEGQVCGDEDDKRYRCIPPGE